MFLNELPKDANIEMGGTLWIHMDGLQRYLDPAHLNATSTASGEDEGMQV